MLHFRQKYKHGPRDQRKPRQARQAPVEKKGESKVEKPHYEREAGESRGIKAFCLLSCITIVFANYGGYFVNIKFNVFHKVLTPFRLCILIYLLCVIFYKRSFQVYYRYTSVLMDPIRALQHLII